MGVRNRAEGINSSLRGISAGCSSGSKSWSGSPSMGVLLLLQSEGAGQ